MYIVFKKNTHFKGEKLIMENKEFMNIIEGLKENINDKIEKFLED